ncbi:MAG: (2Fe-2S) ferredoxin domain-containing protein [Elainella sp. Prado103]|nr:(2Fe-2S) ferredoxin domain-containing protein [Elainella sp. Prado103]
MTKQARATLVQSSPAGIAIPLQPQDTVQIIGVRTVDRSGQPKWKAHRIDRIHTVHGNGLSQEPEQGSSANDESIYPGSDRSLSTSWQTARLSTPDLALRTPLPPVAIRPKKLKILTCHKSGCAKKGGSRQCQILQTLLHDRGLGQHVTVETTGCLGKCSMAPNLILMPGKKRLSGMKPEAIVDLVEHLHHQWGHAASADWKEEAT